MIWPSTNTLHSACSLGKLSKYSSLHSSPSPNADLCDPCRRSWTQCVQSYSAISIQRIFLLSCGSILSNFLSSIHLQNRALYIQHMILAACFPLLRTLLLCVKYLLVLLSSHYRAIWGHHMIGEIFTWIAEL